MATKTTARGAKFYENETEAQIEKRLGPSRKIVRWIPKNKKRRIAVLECGHRRSRTMEKQQTIRCNRCRIEKGAKAVKSVKKAVAVKNGAKNGNGARAKAA